MKKNSFAKLFLGALGYMFMGNFMSLILEITLIPFSGNKFLTVIFAFCAMFIYLSLMFTVAYKDGTNCRKLLKAQNAQNSQNAPKIRWLIISLALWGLSVIFAVILLFNEPFRLPYLLLNGAVAPLDSLLLPEYSPYVFMGFYALTVPACLLGFWCGIKDKLNVDKIVYK